MTEKLKPCPVCGYLESWERVFYKIGPNVAVLCMGCMISGPYFDDCRAGVAAAIEAWNALPRRDGK